MPSAKRAKKPHYDIVLSSTSKELERHRAAVIDAIQSAEFFGRAMENDSALPEDIITGSLNKVRDSDAYVRIIGYRYGQTPESAENPNELSITELEYEEAEKLGLPICMFVMSDRHPVTRGEMRNSTEDEQKHLDAFLGRVAKGHVCVEFDSVEDLKSKVLQSPNELCNRFAERDPLPAILSLVAIPPFTRSHEICRSC